MNLTYYHAPYACSMVSHIALLEAGASFEMVPVSLKAGEQRSETYLAVNPKGKVPTLVANGQRVNENIAIISLLDHLFPAARLLPQETYARIQALSWMSWCSSGLHPPLTRMVRPANFCDLPGSEASVRQLAAAEQRRNFAVIESQLSAGRWLFDHWTAVDGYLYWVWRRFKIVSGEDLSCFPRFADHAARMEQRDSVIRTLALEQRLDPPPG